MATTDGQGLYPLYTTQFSTNLELLLQQQGSKLRGKVAEGMHVGKMASPVNYLGPVKMQAPQGRFAPKARVDADMSRRWVFPQDGEINQLIDSFDKLKTIVDPTSQYTTGAANACGRAWDDAIIAGAFATAYTGQDANALSTESFDTAVYRVATAYGASAATGLTVAKLIETKRILRHWQNDLESDQPYLIIGSQQEADLLNQVQVVSTEYNDKPVLVEGQIKRFMGFDIVMSERLSYGSSIRNVIAGVKSGQYLGIWQDMKNSVSIRYDLSGEPYQLYTQASYGATRLQPGKTIQIQCADTTTADITP